MTVKTGFQMMDMAVHSSFVITMKGIERFFDVLFQSFVIQLV